MRKKTSAFIRSKTVKGRVYWYLVSAFRVDGKPRQKVIGYLGDQRPEGVEDAHRIMKMRESSPARFKKEIGEMPGEEFIQKHTGYSLKLDGFSELVELLNDREMFRAVLRDLRNVARGKGAAYREKKNKETGLSLAVMIRDNAQKICAIDDKLLKCCQFPELTGSESRLLVMVRVRTRLAWRWQRASAECRKVRRVDYRKLNRLLDKSISSCRDFPLQPHGYFKGEVERFLCYGWQLAAAFDPRVLPDPGR